jgi:hypothetical protein
MTDQVTATITSSVGATVASGVVLTYSARRGAWFGSYAIKPTDPPGEWSVTVTAINGSSSGKGYTTFAVGDGVTIMDPPYTTGVAYQVGDTINVDSYAVDTSGNNVTKGTYAATFYLAQNQTTWNGLGKVEARVTLRYNRFARLWEGAFKVPSSVDQGAWVMVVNGTDLAGNKGSAYCWINVGLYVFPSTDSPTYVLGDKISIYANPLYENWTLVKVGTFTAVVYDGSVFLTKVPLTFSYIREPTYSAWLWEGAFTTSLGGPTGFYTITVNGTDGKGNYGSFATVVRVAQYGLSVQASVSNPVVSVQNGNESRLLAKVTYPDGRLMTLGSVIGYLHTSAGVRINWFPMTYNSRAGGFVAINFFHTVNATVTPIGNYTVDIEAYDASGNYGNTTASFSVARPYDVSFVESGLPQGAQWSVTFNDHTQSSTSNSTTFSAVNGVYPFSITPQFGYGVSPPSGSITVNGANATEQITFIPMSINISKTEVIEGDNINVNVTLRNEGNYAETFNVTLYGSQYGQSWPVFTFTDVTLAPNSTVTLTIDGFGFGVGLYTITADAYPIEGMTYVSTSPTILVAPIAFFRPWIWHRPILI